MTDRYKLVASFAHRNLRFLGRYASVSSLGDLPRSLPPLSLRGDERPIGRYEHVGNAGLEYHVFTDDALYTLHSNGWKTIRYPDIAQVIYPTSKLDAASIAVALATGEIFDLPVSGGEGRLRDAFSVGRFLQRVKETLPLDEVT